MSPIDKDKLLDFMGYGKASKHVGDCRLAGNIQLYKAFTGCTVRSQSSEEANFDPHATLYTRPNASSLERLGIPSSDHSLIL